MRSAILLIGLVAFATAANIPFTNCGSSNYQAQVTSVGATPWPPVMGQNVQVVVNANALEQITGGAYELKISFMGLQILDKTGPLTDLGISLPVAPGPFTATYSQAVPSLPIHGAVVITFTATDAAGAPLVCVQVNTNIAQAALPTPPAPLGDNIPFTNCGQSSDKATLSSVTASPWPPVQGQELSLVVNGNSLEVVSAGNYEAKVYFLGIEVEDKTGTLASLNIPMPIQAGPFSITKTEKIPQIPIHGAVTIVLTATDQNSNELLCVQINTNI